MAAAWHSRQGGDRLSALPDRALEHVLSHLSSNEAVRTSVLSRRWRDVFGNVPVVDLVDTKAGKRCHRMDDLKVCFDQQVACAILCKGLETPIRAFRLGLSCPPYEQLDQWIATAASSGLEDLDVNLTVRRSPPVRGLCPFSGSAEAWADLEQDEKKRHFYTMTQHQIFRCRTLRRLRLTSWTLDLPRSLLDLSPLETLCLVRIMDRGGMIQLLLLSCPRLANLTLEECSSIKEITVTSRCLRSFAMICCHNATRVELQTTCLRTLHYKGGLPPRGSSFIVVANHQAVAAARIEICEDLSGKGPREVAPVMRLISRCKRLRYLDLSLRPSMAYYSSLLTCVLRDLPGLRQLGLQGCLLTDHAVRSVVALLLNTKDLQVLSLLPPELGPKIPKEKTPLDLTPLYITDSSESDIEPDDSATIQCRLNDGVECSGRVPEILWRTHVRCLDQKVRRISIGNYQGLPAEKMLARFLLSRAAKLEEFSVKLAAGLHPQKDAIARELTSWRWNRRTRIICN